MGLFHEIKCGKCDRRYSSIRSRCPYCGARKKRSGSAVGGSGGGNNQTQQIIGIAILIIIIIAVVVLVASSLKNKDKDPDPSPSNSISGGSEGVESVEGSATPEITPPPPTATPTPPPPTPTPVVINSIILNREDFTMSRIGETWNLQPTISPTGSDVVIEWRSTDPSVASVDETGTVTAVNRGTATVTATVGDVVAECIVRVAADAPEGSTATVPDNSGDEGSSGSTTLTISHTDVTISSSISESFTISVRGTDETPTFSVGDTSVATINASGKVTAVAPGRTTVYATVGDVKLSCIVRVI